MKSIIIVAFVILGCVALNQALDCYTHELCSTNCPELNKQATATCASDENRCFKQMLATGVKRGCAKDLCKVQVDSNVVGNVCCEKNLCNSAVIPKLGLSTLFMIIGALIFARM